MEAGKVFDMNCQEFWNTMPELARHEDHGGHLRECTACAARWDRQRSLTAGLRTVASEARRLQAPARVEARLTAAFRSHAGLAPEPEAVRLPGFWAPVAAWAAAAAVLVALAMFLVSPRRPQLPRRSAPGAIELASAGASTDFEMGGDSAYGGEDFIPLPNAAGIAPNEDVNLVRVEVPRSAMIELGFAVSAERASEPVEAEVVLGADGLARAVRFLDE